MANVNKVILIGNLTRDPEVKYTPKGSAVADLGMAINRSYTTDGGERREETTFVDVTLWGKTAELAGQYLSKGRPVYIEGRLQLDTWEDKQSGQKRSRLRVVGETMQFLGSRPGGGGDEGGSHGGSGGGERSYDRPAPSYDRPAPARPRPASSSSAPSSHSAGEPPRQEEDDIPF